MHYELKQMNQLSIHYTKKKISIKYSLKQKVLKTTYLFFY